MIKSQTKSGKFWELVIDFAKIKKGGISVNQLLSRFVFCFANQKKKQ
jgi:hypothetical protein